MSNYAVQCDALSMTYGPSQGNHREVLKNVHFTLDKGSFHFLTGASGAGKSTLLSLLALAQRPTSGVIRMLGQNITTAHKSELPSLRRRIGFVFQDARLLNHLTVLENIALPLKIAGVERSTRSKNAQELLEWIGMAQYADSLPEELSGGQQQRIAIARAVITRPEIILADEPTGNLDHELALKCMRLFEALNKDGATLLIATHDEGLIKRMEKPVLRLVDGHTKLIPPKPKVLKKEKEEERILEQLI